MKASFKRSGGNARPGRNFIELLGTGVRMNTRSRTTNMKIMLTLTTILLSIILFSGFVTAQQPALIDREVFFGNPEYAGAQISPDGKYISFIKPLNDVRNVWVKGVDEPFEKARPLTAEKKRPVSGYFWSWDSKYVLFTKDNDGDENFNVFALSSHSKISNF